MELIVILILTLFNGFFALSEIALVSVKRNRMQHLASQGSKNATMVLKLLQNPENFLSSVQVGITLIGIISGAYGGATLTDDIGKVSGSISRLRGSSISYFPSGCNWWNYIFHHCIRGACSKNYCIK